MKCSLWNVALIAGCVLCLGLLSGCGGGGGATPDKTVSNFFKAAKDKDIDAMLKCMSPDLQEVFEEMMKIQGKENVRKMMAAGGEVEKFEIKDSKIDGDTAEVKVAVTTGGETQEDTIPLSKVGGKWYLDFPEEEKKEMKKALEMMKDPKMQEMMKKMQEGMPQGMPTPQE